MAFLIKDDDQHVVVERQAILVYLLESRTVFRRTIKNPSTPIGRSEHRHDRRSDDRIAFLSRIDLIPRRIL